jgi:ferritin-like metal-binding protein YciE
MKDSNGSIVTLHNLLDYDAHKFTSAEIQLKNALISWINTASSFKLKTMLQKYLDFVELHIQKIEKIIIEEDIKTMSVHNIIMKAFIEDTEEKINTCKDSEVKDACLLAAVQTINHYKISMYGTAAAFAKELDMDKIAALFHTSEVVEKQIDEKLSHLAEHEINKRAKTAILLHS